MKGTTWWSRMLLALIGLTFVARILEAECAEYYRIIPLGVAAQSIMGLSWIAKKTEGHELAQTRYGELWERWTITGSAQFSGDVQALVSVAFPELYFILFFRSDVPEDEHCRQLTYVEERRHYQVLPMRVCLNPLGRE